MPKKLQPVKIEGIKGTIRLDKDLNKHLSLAEKELANLKTTFEKSKEMKRPLMERHKKKIITDLKKADEALKKTDILLVKGMALHKTLAKEPFPPKTELIITKIQKEITFLQNKTSLQILTGVQQVQAHSFRSTLDEFKARLSALKKLRRGIRVEAVEHDPNADSKK